MKKTSLPLIGVCWALVLQFAGIAPAAEIVPTPRATVLPVTPTNRPFLAAAMAQEPVNLAARGYTEEEFLLSGNANAYNWPASAAANAPLQVLRPHLPYTTRMLLRRPLDAKRFSGRVIVELLDAAGQGEAAPLWGLSQEHFLRQGDAWVGLTLRPDALATLRRFDPLRYEKVGFAPRVGDCTAPAAAASAPPAAATASVQTEAGLAFDIVGQLGALLRSSSKENPLGVFVVRRVLAAGYSQSGADLITYANALHASLRLGDGRPVFDGYLVAAPAATPAPLSACATVLAADDARRRSGKADVPVVVVLTQSDIDLVPALRQPDIDEAPAVYRGYEIAGASHIGPYAPGLAAAADQAIAALAPDPAATELCTNAPGNFPAGLALNAIWMQLDDLLVRATPMQHAPALQIDAAGKLALDAQGNALGGLRLPQLAVPLAVYSGHSTPKTAAAGSQLCALAGSMRRLDSAELKALYGTRAEYLKRYNAAVDQAVTERWLVPADAVAIKALAARTPLTF